MAGTTAVLLAAMLVVATGSNGLLSAYGQTNERGTAMNSLSSQALSGQIASVQLDDEGNPSWIQSGIWVMRILQASNDSDPLRVQLVARFGMVMPNGNAMHSHSVYNFVVDSYTVDGTTRTFTGTATVTLPAGPVSEVPITVKIFNNTVLAMWIGPEMINSHFGTGPVYGILSSASREIVERVTVRDLDDNVRIRDSSGPEGLNARMVNYYGNASGYLVQPKDAEGQLPAVVMIHENRGLNAFVKGAAEDLAREGYVVLAADLFNSRVTTDPEVARTITAEIRANPEIAIENLNAAVAYLANLDNVDDSKIASLGWCFGGGFSLQLALNAEQPLAATVIYYGALVTDQQELAKITWPVLGIFGSEDQSISVASVNQFKAALDANGTTNEIYIYEGVGHAFANPSNAGHAQEETADAWEKTLNFLSEHL